MMSKIFIAVLLAAFVGLAVAETNFQAAVAATGKCHPECKWQCDDPVCPAVCHPVCERPKCQIQCEETECAKCVVHCDKPQCNVRCPKSLCEKESCPKCETVCSPANCRTKCVAPEANCSPMCEPTKCDWKCKKPISCPKPKCELQCDKPACEARAAFIEVSNEAETAAPVAEAKCCACTGKNLAASMEAASAAHENLSDIEGSLPSFMEVMATMKMQAAEGAEQCCQCHEESQE